MNIGQYLFWIDIAQAVWTVVLLIAMGAVLFAVYKVSQLLAKVETMIDPIAGKVQEVLEKADQTLTSVESKAETMLDISEEAVRSVAAKVDTTSSLVEGAVAKPAISVRSILAGINRGLETWRQFEPDTANGRPDSAPAPAPPVAEAEHAVTS